jgi:hypothetical protein
MMASESSRRRTGGDKTGAFGDFLGFAPTMKIIGLVCELRRKVNRFNGRRIT